MPRSARASELEAGYDPGMADRHEWAEWAARHSRDAVDEDHGAISDLLDREWDPIGVYEGPPEDQAPPGEYLDYAGWIVKALQSGVGAPRSRKLCTRPINMGIGSSPEKSRRTVELVLEWWRARAGNVRICR